MKCLVCDNEIRIDSLKQLFSPQPLRLCSRCSVNLVPAVEAGTLFQRNEWMDTVIERLNRGDLVLIELFKKELLKKISQKEWRGYQIMTENPVQEMPYPWLEILVQQVEKDAKANISECSADVLTLTVEKAKNVENQIGII